MKSGMGDKSFGKRLAEARRRKGYTQEELAHLLGVHTTYVAMLEAGTRNPSFELLRKIVEILDVSYDYLMGVDDKSDHQTRTSPIEEVFGSRLRELRKSKDLSQYYIAQELGIPRTTYANWEQGKADPNLEMLARLAEVLNVSTDYLLGLTDDPAPRSGKLPDYIQKKLEECEKLSKKLEEFRKLARKILGD